MFHRVSIGLIQAAVGEDITENVVKTVKKVKEAAKKGAKIICLQEIYRTRYFPQEDKKDFSGLAETIPGKSTEIFSRLSEELDIAIIVPVFEKFEDKFYNSAVVIEEGKILDTYRKIHVPHDTFFYEKSYFNRGDDYKVYNTKYCKFAVLICYDQWFPEAARIVTLKGAEIIFYPTAIGYIKDSKMEEGDWQDAWETVQRGHAIANGVYVAAVNRVGDEERLKFFGSSFICDPFGNVLVRGSKDKEEVIVSEIDLTKNKEIREGWRFLASRRPDTYDMLIRE